MNNSKIKPFYDSSSHTFKPIEELRQVFAYRYLILQLLRRDIVTRYKRSVLGIAWTMINPLGTMIILTIAFSKVFGQTESYPAYVLSGLLAWNFFSQTTTACMVNLIWGGGLLHRIYMPRTSFALSAIGTGLVNQTLSLVPMLLVLLFTHMKISWALLFLPVPMLLLAGFALGFGLLISTIAVYFPDVSEMYQIMLSAWFYLTPVIYPENMLPSMTQKIIQWVNPMYGLIKMFRAPIYQGIIPPFSELAPVILMVVLVLGAGWILFSLKSEEFAYRI